ncbi:EF-hand calcium-binding domain-containing protein 1 [Coccinella septempunctata]|uniref:EF-hand calcium-binding domain-containing protein 1 n=1 Tax=Coccinella septempunctata TaxID=41139 RepID=UPI001D06E0F0|nr:EF-hand calcium-binding domain-containing protein 1 [Coccinella septempunctata]
MSEENPPEILSMRGGILVMKGVSRFLSATRSRSFIETPPKPKVKKKMPEKENTFKCSLKTIEIMKKETSFSRSEIETLYKIFKKLVVLNRRKSQQGKMNSTQTAAVIGKPNAVQEGIDRTIFREILHNTFDIVTENMLMDRIFCVWDKCNNNLISLESWFKGLDLFLRGSLDAQIEFCFAVYDINADGFITKEEMFQLLKNSLIKHPQEEDPEESVKDLVDIVMKKLDADKDGKVSLEDFKSTIAEEPLLLQAFGTCLPSDRAKETFLSTMK